MLYVSRRRGEIISDPTSLDGVFIYDTDDDTEEFITLQELYETIERTHLAIQGVEDAGLDAISVTPYQVKEEITPLQVKTKLIHNVQVTVWRGMITDIRWDTQSFVNGPVRIRLSDFATKMGDSILYREDYGAAIKNPLILVFDDKLATPPYNALRSGGTFSCTYQWCYEGVIFDISELSNEAFRKEVRESVSIYSTTREGVIIDRRS